MVVSTRMFAKTLQNVFRVSANAQRKGTVNPRFWSKCEMHTSVPLYTGMKQEKCAIREWGVVSEDEQKDFMSFYPQLVEDIVNETKEAGSPMFTAYVEKMILYNIGNGTNFRGLAAAKMYKFLEKPENLTPENIHLSNIMAWVIELSGGLVSMHDDLVDGSKYRRGVPAWWTKKEVGLNCVNDCLVLKDAMYAMLAKYFEHLPCYRPLLNTINKVQLKTDMGYTMDVLVANNQIWECFTVDQCMKKIRMSTGYCSFFWGSEMALHLANITDPELIARNARVMHMMSDQYQLSNDHLDCFGSSRHSGKVENDDIRCGKLTWFASKALELATPSQAKVFKENYAKQHNDNVEAVHKIYADLDIKRHFDQFYHEHSEKLIAEINKLPPPLPQKFYIDLIQDCVGSDPL